MFADANSESRLWDGISIRDLSRRKNVSEYPLIIREFSSSGDFINCIHCEPAAITSIVGPRPAKSWFRSVMAGQESAVVTMRLGGKLVHPSDIALVDAGRLVEEDKSVREVLRSNGIPSRLAEQFCIESGLERYADVSVKSLSPIDRWKVEVCCAFSKDRPIVVVQVPEQANFDAGCERLAQLALDETRRSGKIFVVVGLKRTPRVWQGSPYFREADREKPSKRSTKIRTRRGTSDDVRSQLRRMVRESRISSRDDFVFITRAQLVSGLPSVAVPEALKAEAILNPSIEGVERASDKVAELRKLTESGTMTKVHDSSSTQLQQVKLGRRDTGRLTRVSTLDRLHNQSPVMRLVRSAFRSIKFWD